MFQNISNKYYAFGDLQPAIKKRKKPKLERTGILTLSLLPLSACGGGGSNPAPSNPTTPPPPAPPIVMKTGKVIDGYVHNAEVFIDENDNGIKDTNEVNATTDENGDFTIEQRTGKLIASGGVDTTTGISFENIILSAPSGFSVISPVTTLLDKFPGDETALKQKLGISSTIDLSTYDYVKVLNEGQNPDAGDYLDISQQIMSLAVNLSSLAIGMGLTNDPSIAFGLAIDAIAIGLSNGNGQMNITNNIIFIVDELDTGNVLDANATEKISQLLSSLNELLIDSDTLPDASYLGAIVLTQKILPNLFELVGGDPSAANLAILDQLRLSPLSDISWPDQSDFEPFIFGNYNTFDVGSDQSEDFITTFGNDIIFGLSGDDILHTFGGDDFADGGQGNDVFYAGNGSDILNGSGGKDQLNGESGNDILSGGNGDDILRGGTGNDILIGSEDNDILIGSAGNDTFLYYFNNGKDILFDDYSSNFEVILDIDGFQNGYYRDPTTLDIKDSNGNIIASNTSSEWGIDIVYDHENGVLKRHIENGLTDTSDNGDDILKFGPNLSIDNIRLQMIGDDMVIAFGPSTSAAGPYFFNDFNDTITLKEWGRDWGSAGKPIEKIIFSSTGMEIDTSLIQNWAGGTDTNDTIMGSSGADWITGNAGDDTIHSNGGEDIINGNDGDDIIIINDTSFLSIDGGYYNNSDTLKLDTSGIDLSSTALEKINNIDVIDITGTGNNSITITAQELLNVTKSFDKLIISGNAGDTVTSTGQDWVLGADQTIDGEEYHTYSSGDATLLVDTDITQDIT